MSSDGQQPHILCINHAPEILELLRDLLEEEGYRVSTRLTIDHTLDSIVAMNPDVITIDYMWSNSDDEWTYLNLLTMNPRTRHIPVVLCTGAVKQATEMESHLESIGVRVVLKPFDFDDLLGALQACLEPEQLSDPEVASPETSS